jgi:hypothetical protein
MFLDHFHLLRSDEYSKIESSGLLLWIIMVFVFSGDILKPLLLAHLVTLFAAPFNLVSAFIGALLLIVHVSLIPLTISAIAIKNRVTLKTAPGTTRFLICFGF